MPRAFAPKLQTHCSTKCCEEVSRIRPVINYPRSWQLRRAKTRFLPKAVTSRGNQRWLVRGTIFFSGQFIHCFFFEQRSRHFFSGENSGALGARLMSVLMSRLSTHYCLARKPPCSFFTNVYVTKTPLDFSIVGIDALPFRRQSLENSPSLNNVHMHGKCARFTSFALCGVGKLMMTFGCLKPREYIDRKAPTGTTSLGVPK